MDTKRSQHHSKKHTGFTLVELLVSVSIFAIVMTIATGTLVVLIDANTRAQSLQTAASNLSFAVDSMTRELRTGRNYYCGSSAQAVTALGDDDLIRDCTAGDDHLVYLDGSSGDRVAYRLNTGTGFSRIERVITSGGTWLPITSDELFITTYDLDVRNTDVNDSTQPVITLVIEGYVQDGIDTDTDFRIQTMVTQRQLDIP